MSTNCYKASNNKYFNCPPRMDDGRHFTDYRPNCLTNNLVYNSNSINSSYQFRQFLIHNSNKLMEINRMYSCQQNCCGPCDDPYFQGSMLPEKNIITCNDQSCTKNLNDKNGLGDGRLYSKNCQQCGTWPKQLPVNQPNNCCADNNNLFNYYNDIDNNIQGKDFSRLTVPSGGEAMNGGDPKAYNN